MKKTLEVIFILLLTAGVFIACNKGKLLNPTNDSQVFGARSLKGSSRNLAMMSGGPGRGSENVLADASGDMIVAAPMEASLQNESASFESPESPATSENDAEKRKAFPKKLIKNGSVTLEVPALSGVEKKITDWTVSLGGYVSSSGEYEQSSYFIVRVPKDKFDEAMSSVSTFGVLKEHSASTQDVSEQYYDLDTRLRTKKLVKEKLEGYLKVAKDIKDMLQIELELNNVTSELESMETRLTRLTGEIEYSTISINCRLPYGEKSPETKTGGVGEVLRRFLVNTLHFFPKCLVTLFYIVICGVPVLAIVSLLYWLLFGKVGIIKKLYKWLS